MESIIHTAHRNISAYMPTTRLRKVTGIAVATFITLLQTLAIATAVSPSLAPGSVTGEVSVEGQSGKISGQHDGEDRETVKAMEPI